MIDMIVMGEKYIARTPLNRYTASSFWASELEVGAAEEQKSLWFRN